MKKIISILGATGSVGQSTFKIIDKKKKEFKINILSANKNFELISYQIKKYKPNYYIISDPKIFIKIYNQYKKKNTKILNGFNSLKSFKKSHITVSAIPGIAGLEPTIKMIKYSKKILLANKESIICGWDLIERQALKYKSDIIPVDSEHFSILKLIQNHKISEIEKIYLTASGGPFLNFKLSRLKNVKPAQAIKHPKWKMGKKISVDSSTLMNKILELIEAQKLFNLPEKKLDILIHPNSLVHAIIEFKNGLKEFIYHETSMVIPLANAIFGGKLNIKDFYKLKQDEKNIKSLIFKKVDKRIFPAIQLKERVNEYCSTPIIINASNEILVDQFLQKKIPFLSIFKIIKTILNDRNYRKYAIRKPKNINDIIEIDNWTRNVTLNKIRKL